jgi:transporter family protein
MTIPKWLIYSVLTILLWGVWGVQSKVIVQKITPMLNQVIFTLGLLPVAGLFLVFRTRAGDPKDSKKGRAYAFLTGILGGTGNIAFYEALGRGGNASVVVPLTCLFPAVTVLLAGWWLKERMSVCQQVGLILALVAVIILSS